MKPHGSKEDVTGLEACTQTATPLVTFWPLWDSLIRTPGALCSTQPLLPNIHPAITAAFHLIEGGPGQRYREGWCQVTVPHGLLGQGMAMALHTRDCQCHSPLRVNLEGPSPSLISDSGKNWVCPRVKVEIPYELLICDPWEARRLAQLLHSEKSHWFGFWWEMERQPVDHMCSQLQSRPLGTYEGLYLPLHYSPAGGNVTLTSRKRKHCDRLRERPWKETFLYFNTIMSIFFLLFWPRGSTFPFCTALCKLRGSIYLQTLAEAVLSAQNSTFPLPPFPIHLVVTLTYSLCLGLEVTSSENLSVQFWSSTAKWSNTVSSSLI